MGASERAQSVSQRFMEANGSRYGHNCMVEALLAMTPYDFSMSRAEKSAMWNPMYTMYTVRMKK